MTDQTYIGAVDQGTTGTRFTVFDHGGQAVTNAYRKHAEKRYDRWQEAVERSLDWAQEGGD
jgi:glycerol kinase